MSNGFTVKLTNSEDVIKQLKALDRKVRKKILRKATTAASKVVHKEARRLAPRGNGLFRMSLIVTVRSGKAAVFAKIGQAKNKQFKRKRLKGSAINKRGFAAPLHFVEDGTKSHRIAASSGKALAWIAGKRKGSKGKMAFARSVRHPGTRAQRVLYRAGRYASTRAAATFTAVAAQEMAKIPRPTETE